MAPDTYREILARNIRAARSRIDIGQEDVAARMRALGHDAWIRQTVGATERGRRRPTAEEVLGLAYTLKTTVDRLMTPLWEDKWIEFPSGMGVRVGAVVTLVTGAPGDVPDDLSWYKNTPVRTIIPPHEAEQQDRYDAQPAATPTEETKLPSVATAIVTSSRGVLVGRRNDGKPPWTFIAGEVEEGETPEFAATREVKEETGLEARARDEIGRRVHPRTGREMIYIAAEPVRPDDLEVFVGDEAELAEVRWVSLAEADELMAEYGMFPAVHEHLERELGRP